MDENIDFDTKSPRPRQTIIVLRWRAGDRRQADGRDTKKAISILSLSVSFVPSCLCCSFFSRGLYISSGEGRFLYHVKYKMTETTSRIPDQIQT
jgi:hypothetical protein